MNQLLVKTTKIVIKGVESLEVNTKNQSNKSILVRQKSQFSLNRLFIVFYVLPHDLVNRVPPNLVNTLFPLAPPKKLKGQSF